MRTSVLLVALLVCGVLAGQVLAADATWQFKYRGRIAIEGKAFNGVGTFKFALLDFNGNVLWANGKVGKTDGIPAGTVQLPVSNGVYSVVLGDQKLNMPPLAPSLLRRDEPLTLRIWFDDGAHGLAVVGDTQIMPIVMPQSGSGGKTTTAVGGDDLHDLLLEMRELRAVINRIAPPAAGCSNTSTANAMTTATVSQKKTHVLGDPKAPVTVVEFTDYQCPYCRQFAETVYPELKRNFIDTGKVLYISRNYPLSFHENAMKAAQAAVCAGEQGKYWEMRDLMFAHNTELQQDNLIKLAGSLGLDANQFSACLTSDKARPEVAADIADGNASGVNGTPTHIIGRSSTGDSLTGIKFFGVSAYPDYASVITQLLNSTSGK